eukprot:TRINITY_DN4603_c0_g1_i1.p1 TRINITY_DN4603_c0_g1~~TRINITY_DN4603_c0_g1_i1.p1  ORF type:complete len:2339 (+),score=482.98 TRINITY_DN4603_c0_g1_i1:7388-14404(+)
MDSPRRERNAVPPVPDKRPTTGPPQGTPPPPTRHSHHSTTITHTSTIITSSSGSEPAAASQTPPRPPRQHVPNRNLAPSQPGGGGGSSDEEAINNNTNTPPTFASVKNKISRMSKQREEQQRLWEEQARRGSISGGSDTESKSGRLSGREGTLKFYGEMSAGANLLMAKQKLETEEDNEESESAVSTANTAGAMTEEELDEDDEDTITGGSESFVGGSAGGSGVGDDVMYGSTIADDRHFGSSIGGTENSSGSGGSRVKSRPKSTDRGSRRGSRESTNASNAASASSSGGGEKGEKKKRKKDKKKREKREKEKEKEKGKGSRVERPSGSNESGSVTSSSDLPPLAPLMDSSSSLTTSGSSSTSGSARSSSRAEEWRDFEAVYAAHVARNQGDPLLFPEDNITVVREERKFRTVTNPTPAELVKRQDNDPFWLRLAVHTFSDDWTVVKHSFMQGIEEKEKLDGSLNNPLNQNQVITGLTLRSPRTKFISSRPIQKAESSFELPNEKSNRHSLGEARHNKHGRLSPSNNDNVTVRVNPLLNPNKPLNRFGLAATNAGGSMRELESTSKPSLKDVGFRNNVQLGNLPNRSSLGSSASPATTTSTTAPTSPTTPTSPTAPPTPPESTTAPTPASTTTASASGGSVPPAPPLRGSSPSMIKASSSDNTTVATTPAVTVTPSAVSSTPVTSDKPVAPIKQAPEANPTFFDGTDHLSMSERDYSPDLLQTAVDHVSAKSADLFVHEDNGPSTSRSSLAPFEPFIPPLATRLLITCHPLKFDNTLFFHGYEPLFFSLTLYDLRERTRLSETFYFNHHQESGIDFFGDEADLETQCKKAIMSLHKPTSDVYLVLRIERLLLTNDIDKDMDFYLRHKNCKPKDLQRMKEEVADAVNSWKQSKRGVKKHKSRSEDTMAPMPDFNIPPLQPFAWSALPVFSDGTKLCDSILTTGTLKFDRIYPVQKQGPFDDDSLYEIISELQTDKGIRKEVQKSKTKRKKLSASLTLTVGVLQPTEASSLAPLTLSHQLLPLRPGTEDTKRVIREVDSFEPRREPYAFYVNNLYLYINTLSLPDIKKLNNKNLACLVTLQETDEMHCPLPAFYGTTCNKKMSTARLTIAMPGEKKPAFYDEIKIELPARLNHKHHLLFKFYDVHSDATHADLGPGYVGFTFMKLLDKETNCVISTGAHISSIFTEDVAPGYLQRKPVTERDAKKEGNSMRVNARVVSSLYSEQEALTTLFMLVSHQFPVNEDKGNLISQGMFTSVFNEIARLPDIITLQNMPMLLNCLFCLIAADAERANKKEVLKAIISVIKAVEKMWVGTKVEHNHNLQSYVRYMLPRIDTLLPSRIKSAPLYHNLAKYWLALIKDNQALLNSFGSSRFLLDVIIKSMTIHLQRQGMLQLANRTTRFSDKFNDRLLKIVEHLFFTEIRGVDSLNSLSAFPFFIHSLFDIADRGIAFILVSKYLADMKDFKTRLGKFKFLQTLSDYEYYVSLNMPLPVDKMKVYSLKIPQLLRNHRQHHFLVGTLLKEIQSIQGESGAIRAQAIITLKNLLKKHSTDERYQDSVLKERVANLYFPFVPLLVDGIDQLPSGIEAADWLLCFVWVIRNCTRSLLQSWWNKDTQTRHLAFLRLLSGALRFFKSADFGSEVACTVLVVLTDFMSDFCAEINGSDSSYPEYVFFIIRELLRFQEDQAAEGGMGADKLLGATGEKGLDKIVWSAAASWDAADPSSGGTAVGGIQILLQLYPILQCVVHNFSKAVFQFTSNAKYCEMLSFEILGHCNFSLSPVVRSKATSMFYILLKENWREIGNINRMKVQGTVAVSRLVGGVGGTQINRFKLEKLKESLKAVDQFSKKNASKNPQFEAEVQELIGRMFRLIEYSGRIAEVVRWDPDTAAELYHKISNDYFDSPDLRVRWLDNLAEFQYSQNNLDEAAQCKLHIAFLIAKFLCASPTKGLRRFGDVNDVFRDIAPNIDKEVALPEFKGDESSSDEQNIVYQDTAIWSTDGITKYLQSAIDLLNKAGSYELSLECYMILCNVHNTAKHYASLLTSLAPFQETTTSLIAANRDVRIFPAYYRVAFFGARFQELQGKSFIYKTSGQTKLGHVQTLLKKQHSKRAGGNVDDINILQNVATEDLNPSMLYIQLAAVVPYFDRKEKEQRTSMYEKHFNINHFLFEQGYSESGKNVASDLSKQQKKKTMYRVNNTFPFMRSRIEVVETHEVILTPLENAIELIEGRVEAIVAQLKQSPPRLNSLQQVIQGSVVAMVNEGPLKICEIFLKDSSVDHKGEPYNAQQVAYLREKMSVFVEMCDRAIKLNKSIITPEHIPFQTMVEAKYRELSESVRLYTDFKKK